MIIKSLKTFIFSVVLSMVFVSCYVDSANNTNSADQSVGRNTSESSKKHFDFPEFDGYNITDIINSSSSNFGSYSPYQFQRVLYDDIRAKYNGSTDFNYTKFISSTDFNYTKSVDFCASANRVVLNITNNLTSVKFFKDSLRNTHLCELICSKDLQFSLWQFCRFVVFLHAVNETKSKQSSGSSQFVGEGLPKVSSSANNTKENNKSTSLSPRQPKTETEKVQKSGVQNSDHALNMNPDKNPESYILTYFFVFSVLCIILCLVIYNKKKILALMIEGRRRRNNKRRPSTAAYNRLKCNVEEAVPGSPS